MIPALLLLLAVSPPTKISTLVDDVYNVGAGRTRHLDIAMPAFPVRVLCTFEVETAGAEVRASLISEDRSVIAETALKTHGGLSVRPRLPGKYRLVLDNSHNFAAVRVALYVRLVYGEGPPQPVRRADPIKGQILVLSSMAFFAGVALFAGMRIKRNIDRHDESSCL